jgi:itaconate CoA-transferase
MLPLSGVTVVSLEQAVAAPFASRQLADLGARVVKVERPSVGDFARAYDETVYGQSSYFVWLNRSKESLTLDIKDPAGMDVLRKLLANADVFLHNLGPGAVDRLGLSPEGLSDYPRLIHCAITGYGSAGDWSSKKAYDLLVQSEAGLLSITGTTDNPARVGISVADIAAGMYAYSGILTALFQRERTGEGTSIEVALFDALAEWMGSPLYYTMYGGRPPARAGAQHATIAPYGPFTVGDGSTVMLTIQSSREWLAFCELVLNDPTLADRPQFATNSRRCDNRDVLNGVITDKFSTMTGDEVSSLLDGARIANARVNTMQEFIAHPALSSRKRWRTVETPNGSIQALVPPASIAGSEPRMDPVPGVGEHTDAILAEIGFNPEHIAILRSSGTL